MAFKQESEKERSMNQIITPTGTPAASQVPKIAAVHPTGSKLLVECLKKDEMLGTNLIIAEESEFDGAPQAYVVELGPNVQPHSGIKVGQRVYWTGQGTPVEDPRADKRIRALMDLHNIIAIIEEEGVECCGGGECCEEK